MKRLTDYCLVILLISFSFSACESNDDMFDESLLIGKWEREYIDKDSNKTVKEYYRYDLDYKGVTWVPADDVSEEEAQAFTWKLVSSDLTQIHLMESGSAGIPKTYTVTKLTATTLTYKDSFKNAFTFTKTK